MYMQRPVSGEGADVGHRQLERSAEELCCILQQNCGDHHCRPCTMCLCTTAVTTAAAVAMTMTYQRFTSTTSIAERLSKPARAAVSNRSARVDGVLRRQRCSLDVSATKCNGATGLYVDSSPQIVELCTDNKDEEVTRDLMTRHASVRDANDNRQITVELLFLIDHNNQNNWQNNANWRNCMCGSGRTLIVVASGRGLFC